MMALESFELRSNRRMPHWVTGVAEVGSPA